MAKKKTTLVPTDYDSFLDKNGVKICSGDTIHFVMGGGGSRAYIHEGKVRLVNGKYIHIEYDCWGRTGETKIMFHNCKSRVIIIKGELLDEIKRCPGGTDLSGN